MELGCWSPGASCFRVALYFLTYSSPIEIKLHGLFGQILVGGGLEGEGGERTHGRGREMGLELRLGCVDKAMKDTE